MKKRIWSVVLCLALVCAGFSGCGGKDDATGGMLPERWIKVKLQEFMDGISGVLSEINGMIPAMENIGYDITGSLTFREQFVEIEQTEEEQTEGADTLGLKGSVDAGDSGQMRLTGSLVMDGQDIAGEDTIVENGKTYLNYPGYAKGFKRVSSMNDSAAAALSLKELQGIKDVLAVWGNFSTKFVKAFEYQDKEEEQSIGFGDYKIVGDKYIATANIEDVNAAFGVLMEEIEKFLGFGIGGFMPIGNGLDTLRANYYVGKNGAYAWEFLGGTGDMTLSVVFISTEKGFYFYVVDEDGKERPCVFSLKESNRKGKITIPADEKIGIEYDNYTKNSVDLSTMILGIDLQLKYQSAGSIKTVEFDVKTDGANLSGKLEKTEDHYDLDVLIKVMDMEVGTLKVIAQIRDFAPYDAPDIVSAKEWDAGLDQEKLDGDIKRMTERFPLLNDLLQDAAIH